MISSVCIFFSAGMNNLRTIPIMQAKSALHYRYHRFRQFPAFPYRKRFRILNPIVPPCKRSLFFYILAFTHPLYYFRFFRVTVSPWSGCCPYSLASPHNYTGSFHRQNQSRGDAPGQKEHPCTINFLRPDKAGRVC